jgi:hypothetical protein
MTLLELWHTRLLNDVALEHVRIAFANLSFIVWPEILEDLPVFQVKFCVQYICLVMIDICQFLMPFNFNS